MKTGDYWATFRMRCPQTDPADELRRLVRLALGKPEVDLREMPDWSF